MNVKTLILAIFVAAPFFYSCSHPTPLQGTWADNKGNSFSFFDDGTFSAKIRSAGEDTNYGGNFSILLNSLTFNFKDDELGRIVTEWDIRGNMLYLDWIDEEGNTFSMTLFKISD